MKKEPSVGFFAMLGMTSDGFLGRGPYGEAGAAHRREPIRIPLIKSMSLFRDPCSCYDQNWSIKRPLIAVAKIGIPNDKPILLQKNLINNHKNRRRASLDGKALHEMGLMAGAGYPRGGAPLFSPFPYGG